MISLYTILFVIIGSIYGLTAIYTKIILKNNNKKVVFFFTSFSDYKYLWSLAKKQKKYKLLFILFVSSTILSFVLFLLIVFS